MLWRNKNRSEQVRVSLEGILAISNSIFREGPCEKMSKEGDEEAALRTPVGIPTGVGNHWGISQRDDMMDFRANRLTLGRVQEDKVDAGRMVRKLQDR